MVHADVSTLFGTWRPGTGLRETFGKRLLPTSTNSVLSMLVTVRRCVSARVVEGRDLRARITRAPLTKDVTMPWPVHRFIALRVETRIFRAGDM